TWTTPPSGPIRVQVSVPATAGRARGTRSSRATRAARRCMAISRVCSAILIRVYGRTLGSALLVPRLPDLHHPGLVGARVESRAGARIDHQEAHGQPFQAGAQGLPGKGAVGAPEDAVVERRGVEDVLVDGVEGE